MVTGVEASQSIPYLFGFNSFYYGLIQFILLWLTIYYKIIGLYGMIVMYGIIKAEDPKKVLSDELKARLITLPELLVISSQRANFSQLDTCSQLDICSQLVMCTV